MNSTEMPSMNSLKTSSMNSSETPNTDRMTPEQIEIHAMHNEDLPPHLKYPEQLLFMAFRWLHQSVRAGRVTREQAHNEKAQLLDKFAEWMRWDGIYRDTCKMRVELGGYSKEVELESCERCKQMMIIFDGRK